MLSRKEDSDEDAGEDRRGEGEKGGLASGVQVREKLTGNLRFLKKNRAIGITGHILQRGLKSGGKI